MLADAIILLQGSERVKYLGIYVDTHLKPKSMIGLLWWRMPTDVGVTILINKTFFAASANERCPLISPHDGGKF